MFEKKTTKQKKKAGSMVRPIKIYLQSRIEACITNELSEFKYFQCFPLRNTFIPSYIAIDIVILNNQILKDSRESKFDKLSIWGKVINTSNEALTNPSIKFRGILITDDGGVSVGKRNFETLRGSTSGRKINAEQEDFKYIDIIPKEELLATKGKAVLINPGQRDLSYCKSTKFRKVRQRFKPTSIQDRFS